MHRSVAAAILCFLFSFAPASAERQRLLLPGDYHANEVASKSGEHWLAFVWKAGTGMLTEQILKVEKVKDFVTPEVMGKRVSVTGNSKPVFLVKDITGLKAGTVNCANVRATRDLKPNENLALVMNGKNYVLSVRSWKQIPSATAKAGTEDFDSQDVSLSDGKTTQTINSLRGINILRDTTYGPILLWAGDLDRDGKLDLLINTSHYDNQSLWTLFLSSAAPPGKFVQKVALFTTIGC